MIPECELNGCSIWLQSCLITAELSIHLGSLSRFLIKFLITWSHQLMNNIGLVTMWHSMGWRSVTSGHTGLPAGQSHSLILEGKPAALRSLRGGPACDTHGAWLNVTRPRLPIVTFFSCHSVSEATRIGISSQLECNIISVVHANASSMNRHWCWVKFCEYIFSIILYSCCSWWLNFPASCLMINLSVGVSLPPLHQSVFSLVQKQNT